MSWTSCAERRHVYTTCAAATRDDTTVLQWQEKIRRYCSGERRHEGTAVAREDTQVLQWQEKIRRYCSGERRHAGTAVAREDTTVLQWREKTRRYRSGERRHDGVTVKRVPRHHPHPPSCPPRHMVLRSGKKLQLSGRGSSMIHGLNRTRRHVRAINTKSQRYFACMWS